MENWAGGTGMQIVMGSHLGSGAECVRVVCIGAGRLLLPLGVGGEGILLVSGTDTKAAGGGEGR